MSQSISLTISCHDMEITRALSDGTVRPTNVDLAFAPHMDSLTRHTRFLAKGEFDVAEVSLSSFLIAKDQGLAATAIPVFLSRRFGHGFIYVNTASGIRAPGDLVGRRIGVKQLQFTNIVLIRGILEHEYGVPQTSIDWYCELDEVVEFEQPPGVRIHRLAPGQSVEEMLATGDLDAVLHPDRIAPIRRNDPRVAPLFPDFKREEIAYFQKTGLFPIMHLLAIRDSVDRAHPWIRKSLFDAFLASKSIAMKRMENARLIPLVWYRAAWQEQQDIVGPDPWEYGATAANVRNVDTLAGYAHEQGLIRRRFTFDDLFRSLE
jgi:4,5-dihydroxyphthalate decarboxylase